MSEPRHADNDTTPLRLSGAQLDDLGWPGFVDHDEYEEFLPVRTARQDERCPERCHGRVGHPGFHQTIDYAEILDAARQPTVDVEALASALRSAAERVHGNESHLRASFADCYQWPCTRYRAVLYFADHYGTGLAAQETPERLGSDE